MKKQIIAILLAAAMVLEGTATAPVVAQAEETTTVNTNTSFDTAKELMLDEVCEVTLDGAEEVYYVFTPEEDGYYDFYSESEEEVDPRAMLYDRDGNELTYHDDKENGNDFSLKYRLEADNSYYIKVFKYGGDIGSLSVGLKMATLYAENTSLDVTIKYGETASLEPEIYNTTDTLSYEWYYWEDTGWFPTEETGSTYVIDTNTNEKIYDSYCCRVSNGIDSYIIYYNIAVDTGLTLEDTDVYIEIPYGETETLTVAASGGVGSLSYEWYYWDTKLGSDVRVEGATGNSCQVNGTLDMPNEYYCVVTDGIATQTCCFTLSLESGLTLKESDVYVEIPYGDKAVLSVEASGGAGSLSYAWYYLDKETSEYILIENETESSYEVTATLDMSQEYRCDVTDGIVTKTCYFYSSIDSGLSIQTEESDVIIPDGSTAAISVTTEGGVGDISYQWYYGTDEEFHPIEGATAADYEVIGNEDTKTEYRCIARDAVSEASVDFRLTVLPVREFSFTEELELGEADFATRDMVIYKMIPKEDSAYRFTSAGESDVYVRLLDAQAKKLIYHDDIDEENRNFSLSYSLKADEVYYLVIGVYGTAKPFTVNTETVEFMAHAKGETNLSVSYQDSATLEVEAYSVNGNIGYQWYYIDKITKECVEIEGATQKSLNILADKDVARKYICTVTDGTNTIDVDYYIYVDTGLQLTLDYDEIVPYGGKTTIVANASGGVGEYSYQWYYYDDEIKEEVLIAGATASTYEVAGTKDMISDYVCEVSDEVTLERRYFYLILDTGLKVTDTYNEIYLESGEKATLKAQATGGAGEISYKWDYSDIPVDEHMPTPFPLENVTGSSLEIVGRESTRYTCWVTDGILIRGITFDVYVTGEKVNISEVVTADLEYSTIECDGKKKEPTVIVKDGDVKIHHAKDYYVTYSDNIDAGTATVTIHGVGAYTGTITKTFTITKPKEPEQNKQPVSLVGVTPTLSVTGYHYDGKAKEPEVIVKVGSTILVKDTDYVVSYANNTNIGTATVTVTGKGNYTGTTQATFVITAKKGAAYTAGAYKYKITGADTVAFAGVKNNKTKKVTIGKSVKIGGKTFKITSIANNALAKKNKVTSVTIGENVTKIGKNAFYKCTKLQKITIKSKKLKSVGKKAFKGIKASATVKVPSKKLKQYRKLLKGKGLSGKAKIKK